MNTPRKNNNFQKSSSRNPMVSSMILSILDTLKKKPENKGKNNFEILKEFLNDYRIDGDKGLLEELSKQGNISFDMIKDDGFDIGQIIGDDRNTSASTLHNILNSAQMGELGKNIEKVAINKLIEDIKNKIPNVLKPSFETETNNTKTLGDFKRDIWNFIEYGNGGKVIDEKLVREIKNIKIENKDIVDGLVKEGKLAANDISGDYKNRNANNKKKVDKLITQEYLDGLREDVNYMEKNLNMLKDTFTNFVPNMGWVMDKYPWNEGEIDPEILQKINDAQESGDKQTSDKLSFGAYIQLIQRKNNSLGDILSKLFKNNFDFGKLSNEDQNNFLKESVSARLESLKANNIADLLEVDQSAFDKFVKDIFDLNQKEIIIPSEGGDIKLGVNKKLRGGENPNLVDLSNFADAKLPIELDIKILDNNKDLLNNTALKYVFADNISEDGNNIKLDGNNIGKLILLYAVGEASFDKKDMSKENIQKIEKLLEQVDQKNAIEKIDNEDKENIEEGENGNQNKEDIEESKEKSKKEFWDAWKNIKGYEFVEDKINFGFKEGTRLRVKLGDTELPPADIGGDMRMQLEIIHVGDKDFKVKLTGGEKAATGFEGKEITYPRTKEAIENLSSACSGDIYKLPPPNERDKSLENIKSAGLINLDVGINTFDDIMIKGGNFISRTIEGNPKITHFGSVETKFDDNNLEQKKTINYEVKYNSNGTVDVKYENYKRNMDYNNFIIFISTKRLKPKTKEEAEIEIQNNPNPDKGNKFSFNLQFFSIKNIINNVKKFGKNIEDGMKKYTEKTDKKLLNKMMGDWRIANKLSSLIGWIPGMGEALQNMDSEHQNNMDKETWEKTEIILKIIEGHNDFGSIYDDPKYLNHLLGGQSLKSMIESGSAPGGLNLNNDKRFVASAALLALIKKGPGPYHKLGKKRYDGMRVKLLLGEPYLTRFKQSQSILIEEMKAKQGLYGPGFDAQMANQLARAEIDFLITNIGGRAPGQIIGSSTIPKDGPPGRDGDPRAKKMRSDQFAGELETRFNEFISKSKVEEGAGKLENVNNFTFAYGEYRRFLASERPTKALPYLLKMGELAKSPDQIKKFIGAISYGMLTGFFLHHTSTSTQTRVQTICRTFGFTPGMRANHIDQQRKLSYFFEKASGNFFSKTGYKQSNFEFGKEIGKTGDFIEKFELRRTGDAKSFNDKGNAGNIDTYLNEKMFNNEDEDPIIGQLKNSSLESQQENINDNLSKNSKLMSKYPLLQTKGTIDIISKYKDGYFSGKDVDEIQRSQDVWNAIAKAVPTGAGLDKGRLIFMTKRFLNRFDSSFDDKKHFTRIISTVQNYKNKTNSGSYQQIEKVKLKDNSEKSISTGEITQSDARNILTYAIKGKIIDDQRGGNPPPEFRKAIDAFETMLRNNIEKIDSDFISQVLGKENLEHFGKEKSYVLAPRNTYQEITEKSDFKLTDAQEKLRNDYRNKDDKYINIDMVRLNRNLKRKGGLPSLMQETSNSIGHLDLE